MYKLVYNSDGVQRLTDMAFIPNASGNPDWQEYQLWLAESNTPDPALTQAQIDDMAAKAAAQAQRAQDIIDNLPAWAQVSSAIINAFPDPAQQNIILKQARIVYWLGKNTAD